MVDLAVIIVSYNVRAFLKEALHSLETSLAKSDLRSRVIVVENDSHDGSADMVRTHFPTVELLEPRRNLGFAGGNNLALRHLGFAPNQDLEESQQTAEAEFIWLLNCDTKVIDDAPLQLLNHMRQKASVGAVGPKLLYGDLTLQHSAFAFPGLSQIALDLFPLSGRLLESPLNGRYGPHLWKGTEPFEVDMLLGAALMIRGKAIQQIGLMDEGYFMYVEELDWCRALQKAGWQSEVVPTAVVIHYGGQSTSQFRDRMFVALWRSRLRYYQKWASPAYVWLVRAVLRAGMIKKIREAQKISDKNERMRRIAAYREVKML